MGCAGLLTDSRGAGGLAELRWQRLGDLKLAACALDDRTLRWVKNWLMAGPKELWGTELNPVGGRSRVVSPRARFWGHSCLTSLLML